MTQIAATDIALVNLLQSCGFPGVDTASAPHEWDGNYVQQLLSKTPAIRVVFVGAVPHGDTRSSTTLNMVGEWRVYIATGWNGADQRARRLGSGAGFDLTHRAAAALHNAVLTDPTDNSRLPIASVVGIEILADAALDIGNLWVAGISVEVELPLELTESDSCYGPLDDFIRARASFDLPGVGKPAPDISDVGDEGDLPARVDLPQ